MTLSDVTYPARIARNRYLSISDVNDPETFAQYAQQNLGVPWPTLRDMTVLRKKSKEFFEHYPHCKWETLCRVVDWAKRKRKRFAYVWQAVDAFRWAWQDGAIPELDRVTDEAVESGIREALLVETDPVWRQMMVCTEDRNKRRDILDEWLERREPTLRVR